MRLTAIIYFRRDGTLADRNPGASGIQDANGLIGQLPIWDVTVGKLDRALPRLRLITGFDGMLFHHGGNAAHHQYNAFSSVGSSIFTT